MKNEVVAGLIDPDRVNDIFCEGIASIEHAGAHCVRITMFATRNLGDGDIDRIVVARIVTSIGTLPLNLKQTSAFVNGNGFMAGTRDDTGLN